MKPLTNAVGLRVHDLCLGVLNVVQSQVQLVVMGVDAG